MEDAEGIGCYYGFDLLPDEVLYFMFEESFASLPDKALLTISRVSKRYTLS